MASKIELRKDEAIGQAGALARRSVAGKGGEAAERFLRQFYAAVAPEDVADLSPEDLAGSALALWRFGQSRPPQTPKVRAYNPRVADHGWTCGHTVVEIVNDDMPFLVDSVTGWLTQKAIGLHQLIHPVIRVKRDAKGDLAELLPVESGDGQAESVMHLQIDSQSGTADLAAIEAGLKAALADVRAAVEDWPAMRARAAAILEELARAPGVPEEELAEARGFLGWLDANHFTYLGYREYAFGGDAAEPGLGRVVEGSGLGVLREPDTAIFHPTTEAAALPPDMRALVRAPNVLMIAKANKRSTVHRPVHFDTVGIKKYDAKGRVVGEYRFIGLFTSDIYNLSPRLIPLLRRKVAHVMARSKLAPASHDGKALLHILETFPRDELFQIAEEDLAEISLGILHLQDRARVALFIRRDPFERFLSCLVFAPRDRFDTDLRLKFQDILCRELQGTVSAFYTQIGDSPLARLHVIVKTKPGAVPDYDRREIEAKLARAMRAWRDDLRAALVAAHGEDAGLDLLKRYGDAFPSAYRETVPANHAVADIAKIEASRAGGPLGLNLYRPLGAPDDSVRFKIYNASDAVPLSDVLPMLENMGFRVIDEQPYRIELTSDHDSVWIHDFGMETRAGAAVDLDGVKPLLEAAFARLWAGEMENDGFNKLALLGGLGWREITMLRAIAKYLRQAGIPFSQAYMETTFANNPAFARLLADLFAARFDPQRRQGAEAREVSLKVAYEEALDKVASLDEDRILRRFLNVALSMLRTNFYQADAAGAPKLYLSFKLDSRAVDDLPLPRPFYEVFVYSPRMEGIHLRGGKVARGGIRWSDRREDFRTEILGLMKAQMVKNAVIVPVGAKGGFVLKQLLAGAGRDETMAEGIACYRLLMQGLLDITDNRVGVGIVPPKDVIRHDDDDPYLVVAADKGTATFSDIANGIARDYGFWLDDAFASGGSAGYDHKKMGITARGAWESVKRHFREIGVDTQSQDFTVIGVGDMSGDVFGNGMLLSPHIKLLAAFNHLHIFIDPSPDPAASLEERKRLFALPRSSWSDYDAALISKGGGVFDRKAKSIKLTPEIQDLFGIKQETLAPNDLIRTLLKAEVDLLFFGGIGTFIKAATESHAEAGDRANDALRIDGSDVRAKVIGEGANLGMTQLGRVEYAKTGGRLNTDAVDNSAGVDASDHEVNIKILTGTVVAEGDITLKQRDVLLAEMTDELAGLILRDNYLQTQAITVMEAQGGAILDSQVRLIQDLEKAGKLNREVEKLPNDATLAALAALSQGLTRPELAVLLAYGKMTLYETLLASDLPDEAFLGEDLHRYFPTALRERFPQAIDKHRLRREIIATVATNSMVNRVGPTFVNDLRARTGCAEGDIARAYTVTRDAFALREFWAGVEALDAKAPAGLQTAMILESARLVERVTLWFAQNRSHPIDVAATMRSFAPAVAALKAALPDALPAAARERHDAAVAAYIQDGAPADLAVAAAMLPALAGAADIVKLAGDDAAKVASAAMVYYAAGDRLSLDWLRASARAIAATTSWQKQAVAAIVDELFAFQAELAARILAGGQTPDAWLAARGPVFLRAQQVLGEMQGAGAAAGGPRKDGAPAPAGVDLAMLAVANRQLRALIAA
ncbi:MAG: NAD-glutamate dehydrogenase [Alphaproteobacteria bacterium]